MNLLGCPSLKDDVCKIMPRERSNHRRSLRSLASYQVLFLDANVRRRSYKTLCNIGTGYSSLPTGRIFLSSWLRRPDARSVVKFSFRASIHSWLQNALNVKSNGIFELWIDFAKCRLARCFSGRSKYLLSIVDERC